MAPQAGLKPTTLRLTVAGIESQALATIPDRLQKTIGKAKEQKIEDCLFTEVVVDAKDSRFRKHRMKCGVQLLCRSKVASKRLLDNDS